MYEVIVQLYKYRQLVRVHGITGELIHSVLKRNAAALRYPCGNVGAVLGKDTACTVIGFYDRSHAAEQALSLDRLLELVVAAGRQCIPTDNAVCSTMDLIVCVLNTSISVTHRAFVQPQRVKIFASTYLFEVIALAARALDVVGECHFNVMGLLGMKTVVAAGVVVSVTDV